MQAVTPPPLQRSLTHRHSNPAPHTHVCELSQISEWAVEDDACYGGVAVAVQQCRRSAHGPAPETHRRHLPCTPKVVHNLVQCTPRE
jgi:hypothetical protein